MKHNILTYSLLAAFCAAAPLQAAPAAKDAAAVKAEAEAKKKAEAEAKKKAEAEKKAAEAKKKAEAEAARKAAAEARKKAEEAKKKAAAEAKARMKEFQDYVGMMNKKKVHYDTRIENVLKFAERPDMKTDNAIRYAAYVQALKYTENPPWTQIGIYNYDTIHKVMPVVSKMILDDPAFTNSQKFYGAITRLIQYYCDCENWTEAEAWARWGMELDMHVNDKANACLQLAKVFRYQFRYEDAMNAAREAMKYYKVHAAPFASDLAYEFGKPEDAIPFWKDYANEYDELSYFAGKEWNKYKDRAMAYITDEKNRANLRYNIVAKYFLTGKSEIAQKAREATAGLPALVKVGGYHGGRPLKTAFQLGDYPMTVTLCEYFAGTPLMMDYDMQCVYVIALGGVGRKADAAKAAAEYAKNEKLNPVQKTRLLAYEALLTGKDPEAVISAAKLPRKDEATIYLSLARQTLSVWNMTPLAEKYTAKYESYFAKPVERRINVVYSEKPIRNISEWRKIYPKLEKQYCDIPYKGSMDFLETDVSTGDRGVVKAEDGAILEDMMEITTVCDRDGVHIFLRTNDSQARAIEQGFARGIGTEMYFAPGVNQPYVCMGSNPTAGVTFMFQTTYNNKNATRPDMQKNPTTGFRSEVEFSDTDYVLHLFFGWDLYYNKLPAPGTDWRFDCLAWSKAGGFSWGGSQGIHSASAWGYLRFNLTDKQLNEIRKGIIFRTYRSYMNIRQEPGVSENLFRIWEDSVIGDPDFYQKMLAPLEAELAAYAKMVKYDMTDAEVAEVYTKALPRWKGLTHEVDELRRKYLSERITNFGK